MKVMLTGGGTGGHINPAIAIARTILEHQPDSEIIFVGTSKGMENRLIPKEGFKLYHIEMQGLKRKLSLSNLKTLFLTATSVGKAKKLIKEIKPDICIGTGGYVSWPLIKAAASMKVPTAMHESNALAGVAIKLLAPYIDVLFVNFESTADQIKKCKKILHVGNPLKQGFSSITKEEARAKLGFENKYRYSLLSCGGSNGAGRINAEALKLMAEFTSKHPEIHHLHQAGVINYEKTRAEFERLGLDKYENLTLVDYIYDMPDRLAAADLVINRAGAMTISELAHLKKPSILIPSPNVTDNHQYKNAKVLSDAGAVRLISEGELTDGVLAKNVEELILDREARRVMGENFGKFAIKDANELIYNEILHLVNSK